jgi:hypothetical protein
MAAPTLTWYEATDNAGSPDYSSISVLAFGNVQAGFPSAVKAVVAKFDFDTPAGLGRLGG